MGGLVMKYFVLKPKGTDIYAKSSRRAMRSYAALVRSENPDLANELHEWADREFIEALENGMYDKSEEKQ